MKSLWNSENLVSKKDLLKILKKNGVQTDSLLFYSEGWDNMVYLLNNSYIILLPKRESVTKRMREEICFLTKYHQFLTVRVPEFEIIIESPEVKGLILGYQKFKGKIFSCRLDSKNNINIATLAKFLQKLHSIEASSKIVSNTTDLKNYKTASKKAFNSIKHCVSGKFEALIKRSFLYNIPEKGDSLVYIHNDLRPCHILISSTQEMMIIDWADIALGRPWEDLLWLWLYGGNSFIKVLSNYYNGWQENWMESIMNVGIWKAVLEYYYGKKTNDQEKIKVALSALAHFSDI